MTETADPGYVNPDKETYAEQLRDQIARAHNQCALIATIDADGQVAVSSPMGYAPRQVAAMLHLIADKIDRTADANGIPELADDERPGDIPDGSIHLA